MASISTSPRHQTRYFLRLREKGFGGSFKPDGQLFSLYEQRRRERDVELETSGTVKESGEYAVDLLSSEPIEGPDIWLRIGDEEPKSMYASKISTPVEIEGQNFHWYNLNFDNDTKPFRLTYGFARVEVVVLEYPSGTKRSLSTRDIPCASTYADQKRIVSAMFDELTSAQADTAVSWMLRVPHGNEESAALLQGVLSTTSKSLRSYVALVEDVLEGYRSCLSYIRGHAHSKTTRIETMIDAEKVQRLGHSELIWMARNLDGLHEAPRGMGIDYGGKTYSTREVQTRTIQRAFDNRENRALLSFLGILCSSLSEASNKMSEAIAEMSDMLTELERMDVDGSLTLAMSVVRTCSELEAPLLRKAIELRREATRVRRLYRQALPGVKEVPYRKPSRTKVFQEIPAYAALYDLMERWDHFGSFSIERDGLLLHTSRIDRLYEYYVLYRMLDWLNKAGFKPAESDDFSIEQVAYSLTSPYFINEDQIANRYVLARGQETITILYEPVCYGDSREEGGNILHRVSSTQEASPFDSYWYPDYVLYRHVNGELVRTAVIDAKFSTTSKMGVHEEPGKGSIFWQCYSKYKGSMLTKYGRQIDSLWLLCGRMTRRHIEVLQDSSWSKNNPQMSRDGVASLSPYADCLQEMFGSLGITLSASAIKVEEGASSASPLVAYATTQVIPADIASLQSTTIDGGTMTPKSSPFSGEAATERKAVMRMCPAPLDSPSVSSLELTRAEVDNRAHNVSKPLPQASSRKKRGDSHTSPSHSFALDDKVLLLVNSLFETVADNEVLLSARFAREAASLSHPILRVARPSGNERKRYTSEPLRMGNERFYVYRSWMPPQIAKLERFLGKAKAPGNEALRAEKPSQERLGGPKLQKTDVDKEKTAPRKRVPQDSKMLELIIEAIELVDDAKVLESTDFCHRKFGLNKPALSATKPSGTVSEYREIEVNGRTLYLLRRWTKFNVLKLETFIKSKRRVKGKEGGQ